MNGHHLIDWEEAAPAPLPPRRRRRDGRTRQTLLAAAVLGLLLAPFGVAATGDALREGLRNGTTSSETEIIGSIAASTGPKGGYVTRQSNVRTGAQAGGAAIYGCRVPRGGSESCLRASNLAGGPAFGFASTAGPAGAFTPGSPGDAPFEVGGTGVVTNLNADKLDGKDASDLAGATGPAGPAGPAGATGPAGPSGFSAVTIRDAFFVSDAGGNTGFETASCLAGERALGGGITWTQSPGGGDAVKQTGPISGIEVYPDENDPPTGWGGVIETSDGAGKEGRVYVICARI